MEEEVEEEAMVGSCADCTSAHMTPQHPDACRENGSHGGSGPLAPGRFWFFGTWKVLVYWHQEISLVVVVVVVLW